MYQLLVSIGCDTIQINHLYRITNRMDLPGDTLQSLETELKGHLDATAYVRAIDRERIMLGLQGYQTLLDGSYRDVLKVFGNLPAINAWLYRTSGLMHRDVTVFLTLQAEIQDECRMESDNVLASLRRNPIEKQIPASCRLSRIMLPQLEGILITKARYEAVLQVTRVGLALKRYKLAHGVYPDTLAPLTPSFLDRIPKDPCSGKSLLYRKDGDGFLLYSVGSDLQDNQGVPFNFKSSTAPYDFVWKAIR